MVRISSINMILFKVNSLILFVWNLGLYYLRKFDIMWSKGIRGMAMRMSSGDHSVGSNDSLLVWFIFY